VKKSALRDAILQELREELARQTIAAQLARDEAISEESQPENKWDTHSQEAAYLAEGQAKLVVEVGQNIELFQTLALPDFTASDPIALGALIGLEGGGKTIWYFMGPRAGGLELLVDGRKVLVVTPQSPLGRQLIGKRVGDTISSPGTTSQTAQRIAAVE
jgi:transcription elongation GreA/GreB family factor